MLNSCRVLTFLTAASLMAAIGCGQQAQHMKEMTKPTWVEKQATWKELDDLFHSTEGPSMEKVIRGMSPRFGGGDPKQAAKFFDDPGFQERLKKFADTPVPSEFKNPEREAAKDELVAGFKKLAEIGKKGDLKAFVAQNRKNSETYHKIIKIPGQKPPEGKEAEKYAPVSTPQK